MGQIQAVNNSDGVFVSARLGFFSKIPSNQSSNFVHQVFWKKISEFLAIPYYQVEKKSKLMVLITLCDR